MTTETVTTETPAPTDTTVLGTPPPATSPAPPAPPAAEPAAPAAPQTEPEPTTPEGEAKADTAAPVDIEVVLPEGVVADEKFLGEVKAIAKETGVSQQAVQKMADAYVR